MRADLSARSGCFGGRAFTASRNMSRIISDKKRGVFGSIKRELRRRSAIDAIFSATGQNLCLLLAWLRIPLPLILIALRRLFAIPPALNPTS